MNALSQLMMAFLAAGAFLVAPSGAHADETATVKEEANLRTLPTTASRALAVLPADASIEVECWREGEPTFGTDKFGSMWLYTDTGGWIHSQLVTPVDVSECADGVGVLAVPGGAYVDCDQARESGPTPLKSTEPGYGPHLDRDRDGLGCEWDVEDD